MPDVNIKYKGNSIGSMSDTGTKTLKTQGKYLEGDVAVEYTKPSAGVTAEPLSVTENGTYTAPAGKAYSPVTVNVAGGGGNPSASPKAVNFIDHDGTIRYSYTAAEFAALTAMPANPTHDGLTAQGWNYTLAKAQTYVAKYGRLWIGQMYITDDGKTRVYIRLEEGRTSPMLGCCPNGTVDVDWGDGTAHNTLTGTSTSEVKWTQTHNYTAPGDYVIKLTVTGGMEFYGSSSSDQYSGLLRYSGDADSRNNAYRNAIQRVEIGNGVTSIGNDVFHNCYSLASVTIPEGVTSIGNDVFNACYSLASVTIPEGVTSIGTYVFYNCNSLASVTIPESVTSIGTYAFSGCYSLANVTIPESVKSIGTYAFNNCYSLASVTIPESVTSIGTYAFYNCYSLASVTIPENVTSISTNTFYRCYSLASVTIPDGVTSVGANAFNNCNSLAYIRFLTQTPPSVSKANAFSGIPADCEIHVPHGTLSAYTTATNYPSASTYTYVEDIA